MHKLCSRLQASERPPARKRILHVHQRQTAQLRLLGSRLGAAKSDLSRRCTKRDCDDLARNARALPAIQAPLPRCHGVDALFGKQAIGVCVCVCECVCARKQLYFHICFCVMTLVDTCMCLWLLVVSFPIAPTHKYDFLRCNMPG